MDSSEALLEIQHFLRRSPSATSGMGGDSQCARRPNFFAGTATYSRMYERHDGGGVRERRLLKISSNLWGKMQSDEIEQLMFESLASAAATWIARGHSETETIDKLEILGAKIWAGLDELQGHRAN
jgi:hypothetical protein